MAKIKEVYIVSIDIAEAVKDATVLSVAEWDNNHFKFINQFTGEEAKWMYERLINKQNREEDQNE